MTDRTKDDWVKRKGGNAGVWDSPLASRLFAALLTLVASYLGYEKVEEYRSDAAAAAAVAAESNQSVDIRIEAPIKSSGHSHGSVVSKIVIERMIEKEIKALHERDVEEFKRKESWDNK